MPFCAWSWARSSCLNASVELISIANKLGMFVVSLHWVVRLVMVLWNEGCGLIWWSRRLSLAVSVDLAVIVKEFGEVERSHVGELHVGRLAACETAL